MAVLVKPPVVPAGTVPVRVKVMPPPLGTVTRASMLPVPLAVAQLAPALAGAQVQAKPAS